MCPYDFDDHPIATKLIAADRAMRSIEHDYEDAFVPDEQRLLRESERPMSERIRPIGDRVIVRQDQRKAMSASGRLHLPDSAKVQDCTGWVIAVGPKVTNVTKGDRVIFKRRAMSALLPDDWCEGDNRNPDADVLVLRDEDMIAVLDPSIVVEVARAR